MATEQNFTGSNSRITGDKLTFTLTFTDSDGVAIDITSWTIFFTAKPDVDTDDTDAEAVLEKTLSGGDLTDPTNGITTFSFSNSDTKDLEGGFYYDIQSKKGDGSIVTVLYGALNFIADITRRTS